MPIILTKKPVLVFIYLLVFAKNNNYENQGFMEINCKNISEGTGLNVPQVSYNLKILADLNFIIKKKIGAGDNLPLGGGVCITIRDWEIFKIVISAFVKEPEPVQTSQSCDRELIKCIERGFKSLTELF